MTVVVFCFAGIACCRRAICTTQYHRVYYTGVFFLFIFFNFFFSFFILLICFLCSVSPKRRRRHCREQRSRATVRQPPAAGSDEARH